ncbi:hypothetical protein JJ691_23050 [Kutzneria sp. CA-103260]|nr:hypothetical protein JJ691_23050 [Kutzneria sp. CA-103260]
MRMGGNAGQDLDLTGLHELHRAGVLVPMFRVKLELGQVDYGIEVAASRNSKHSTSTVISDLYTGASEGPAAVV